MKNKLKTELLEKYSQMSLEEQRRLAAQYLSNITELQEKLRIEEQELMQLLRNLRSQGIEILAL